MIKVVIDDPDAAHYPFKFRKGDMVALRLDPEGKGEIVDGEFEGSLGGGSYSLIYTVKRLKDGFCYKAKDLELEKLDPDNS